MEPKLTSRKRKQVPPPPSSNPFQGIFTRSKSQIYIHQSRSGRARYDVIRRCNHTQFGEEPPRVRSRRSNRQEGLRVDSLSHICIKDLRARRVFSPTSSLIEHEDSYNGRGISKFVDNCQILNDANPDLYSKSEDCCNRDNDLDRTDIENLTDHGVELIVDLNKNVSFMEVSCDGNLKENEGDLNLSEDCVQMTPSETDEIGGNGGRKGTISNSNVCVNNFDSSNVSIPRSKRVKVFKTPSSFSYRRLLPYLMDISKDDSCIQKIEIVDLEFPCKVQKLDHVSPNFSSMPVDNCAQSIDTKPSENGGVEDHNVESHKEEHRRDGEDTVDMNDDDSRQMTPPDNDIFTKPDEGDRTKDKDYDILQSDDTLLDKPLNGSLNHCESGDIGNFPDSDRTKGLISKSKPVLNPCSRVKVFKVPSSVSYRRLLPFLTDAAKDNPGSSTISQGPNHVKDTDQKLHPIILPSSSLDVQNDKFETDTISEDKDSNVNEEPKLLNDLTHEPNQILSSSCNNGVISYAANWTEVSTSTNVNPEHITRECVLDVSKGTLVDSKEDQLQQMGNDVNEEPKSLNDSTHEPNQILPNSCNNGVISYVANCTEVSTSTNVNLEYITRECELDVSKGTLVDSKEDQLLQMDDENEELVKESLCPNSSSPSKEIDPLGTSVSDMRKGILRRNPRGCRGLCNCLNCASFRLHADKAFEFSRNQMHDVEEIASELINELRYIRNLLNETAANLCVVNVKQVKEACDNALKTEELVKKRLGNMNEDLKFHCRNACLQRPRVTFSSNIKQKLIPKAGRTWK